MPLEVGTRLGPYEILAPLGAGGMGEVYRARDMKLGRDVAIKVLPDAVASEPDRVRRFEREAHSASALNHPNIVTIYDVGRAGSVSWIAMELVGGRSLREILAAGPLPVKKLLSIGTQIAEGLARAHAASIVHRDLKPENVMVTPDGLVKILDFGLAKLTPEMPEGSNAATLTQQTEAGVILGTVGYMSPEQAMGHAVDHRSDQFSFGGILYEMATGVRPFQRASAIETLSAILKEEPRPLTGLNPAASESLEWIVRRCLAKEPEERYASTRDLARDLANLRDRVADTTAPPLARSSGVAAGSHSPLGLVIMGAAALALVLGGWLLLQRRGGHTAVAERGRSIAILPFQNFGGRAEDDYFSDGMTESLITDLAKTKELLVIARNSVFSYKNKPVDVRKVGDDLGVRYVLEGSVWRSGDLVRVNAQLIDTATGYHVWAEKYDRPMKDVFALQDDISSHIAGALKVTLARPGVPASITTPTSNLEAYDVFLRGRYFLNQFDWVEKDKSIPLFERAVTLDPGFAAAHASLGTAFAKKAFEGDPSGAWRAKASAAIEKALALDPQLAQAYVARGMLAWSRENRFPHEQAAADYHRAIELNPNDDTAHGQLAGLYYHVGLLEEALAEYGIALKINPRELDYLYRIPRIHLYQQKYSLALEEFDANPRFRDDFLKPIVVEHLGRHDEALRLAEAHSLSNRTHPKAYETADAAGTHAVLAAREGDSRRAEEKIRAAVEKGGSGSHFHHTAYNIACAYALLGKKKEALEWLEKTADEGMPCYPLFEKDPFLDSLRSDPGFSAFLGRIKLQRERFRTGL